ncbi:diaminopimelate decarboxylase [Xylocopilactobacillus apicola]|uniref:Diaminopimelate decarboxylase n=1 Tax=Xylocopilactobacillus apicola TaxID=2932184 RepID=A0AAU9CYI4_9LACO|nr:diaminopimelate decarboxylase [Xylocopilactobacillus apicola]BDR59084.1 diaminopimelate decarboxylase [Xylocopilactobacillus apicola]
MENEKYFTNKEGHLVIGGVDALKLALEYGTPLVAYDVSQIRSQIRAFKEAFAKRKFPAVVSYASKAFSAIAMYQVVAQEKAHIDVVSGGELYTAIKANFPMDKISFHGNNKTRAELEMAVEHQVGVIILDNFYEIELLSEVLAEQDKNIRVMLRLTPNVSAHTHEYIQTGQADSKFGFDITTGQAHSALKKVQANPQMELIGLHAHIGSQISAVAGFQMEVANLFKLINQWNAQDHYQPKVINLGGGFGIRYTEEDEVLAPDVFVGAIVDEVKAQCDQLNLKVPEIWIEPGRSIVGAAGYSLYTVGSRKNLPGMTDYLTVNGGMGDNIRPALYQAKYEAVLANNPTAASVEKVHLAGRYCESGDILIDEQSLPATKPGDIIAILKTGAYGYSMASNYNRVPRPSVVFCENGYAQIVVKRETYDDLVSNDCFLEKEL